MYIYIYIYIHVYVYGFSTLIFKGSAVMFMLVDLGRLITITEMRLMPRTTDTGYDNNTINAPGRFKIYGSSDPSDWTNHASATWVLIHDHTRALPYISGDFITSFSVEASEAYSMYAMTIQALAG